MRVFSTCLRILKKNIIFLAAYNLLFLGIGIVAGKFYADEYENGGAGFQTSGFTYIWINRDAPSPYTDGLGAYLEKYGKRAEAEDQKEALQDALFYETADVIVVVPEGFSRAVQAGEDAAVDISFKPDSAVGYYVQSMLQSYLELLEISRGLAPGPQEQSELAQELLRTEVQTEQISAGGAGGAGSYFKMFNTLEYYVLMVVAMLTISSVEIPFKSSDIRIRNKVSPLRPGAIVVQKGLSAVLCTVSIWLITTAMSVLVDLKGAAAMDSRMLLLLWLNSFTAALTAMSAALLSSLFVKNFMIQNAVSNIVTLGMCFLGGIFVPLELLGEGVRAVGHYLPSYWYSRAVNDICGLNSYQFEALRPVLTDLAVQWGFTAAFFCIALALSKYYSRAERAYGSSRTELAA